VCVCVVSAQGQGLLCEVPRSAKDSNVKYIGYCSYHYKKMVCALGLPVFVAFSDATVNLYLFLKVE